MVYSNFRCSKVTTLVRCQTYCLEIEAYFSTNRAVCKTEQFQFAGDSIIRRFFLNHHNLEPLCSAKNTASTVAKLQISLTGKTQQFGMNPFVSNEKFCYSTQTFECNWLTWHFNKTNFFCLGGSRVLKRPFDLYHFYTPFHLVRQSL